MTGNSEKYHRDGKTRRSLSGRIDKKQADKDMDELKSLDVKRCMFLSESSLKKDWLKPEEDRAWREL
jgi:hypothetical protein